MNYPAVAIAAQNIEVIYRTLCADDAEAYRDIRTKALTSEGKHGLVVANPEQELTRTLDEWRAVCAETCDKAVVGAFAEGKLVGVMTVMRWDEDPSGRTAYLRAAYVCPEFRNGDVTRTLIKMHDSWAKNHGCDKAVYTVRADLKKWLNNQMKAGAKISSTSLMRYADGTTALTNWMERSLIGFPKQQIG